MTQMCTPQQTGKSVDPYCHQCDATNHVVNDAPANHAGYLKATHTEDTESTQPVT